MKLAETVTPDGGQLELYTYEGNYKILLDGLELMHSVTANSEVEMGLRMAERLRECRAPHYLIGGLGMGFTLRAILKNLPPDGLVEVAELLPEVVRWNREYMCELNGALLDDPRVMVHETDVACLLADCLPGTYDGILLDVDNGPVPIVHGDNIQLYSEEGLEWIKHALRPGGQVAFWSAEAEPRFRRRLVRRGFAVEEVPTKAYPESEQSDYLLYFAFLADSRQAVGGGSSERA